MRDPFPILTPADRAALHAQLPARGAALASELGWLDALDVWPPPAEPTPPAALTVAVFNVERGTCFDAIVALVHAHAALRAVDVWLLNEVDWGMARSGNRHVARELAERLGVGGVFGVEYVELSKGAGAEREAPGDDARGLHGNAILSRLPLRRPRLVRLPRCWEWADDDQPRLGGRMALLAEVETAAGPLSLACTHLENRAAPDGRRRQMAALLAALPPGPALIGGDLNTATIDGGRPEEIFSLPERLREEPERLRRPAAHEPLFAAARAAGFAVEPFNAAAAPTAVPLGITDPAYWLKLDWILARGAQLVSAPHSPGVVPAVQGGERVSDHDVVVVRLALPVERTRLP